jgi:hypothetical protein
VEKQLLARGEHEFCAAVITLQNSVDEFHGRLPQSREDCRKGAMIMRARRSRFPVFELPWTTRARAAAKRGADVAACLRNTGD